MQHSFLHFFPSNERLRRENAFISRFMEDVKKRRQNSFPFWTLVWFLGVQLQEVSPSFDRVNKLEWPRKRLKERELAFFY